LGYMPVAPATASCVISVIIWYFLIPFRPIYVAVAIVLFVLGVVISDSLTSSWGKDPRTIVIDEYACLLFPLYFTPKRLIPLIITFLLFRIFDILKPPPIKALEHLRGGWGVMLDDLGAAIYTTIIIVIIFALGARF
jgi:phosphatidylglycerophosphatase A